MSASDVGSEKLVLQCLGDPEFRKILLPVLHPWMFSEDPPKKVLQVLKDPKYSDGVYSETALALDFANKAKLSQTQVTAACRLLKNPPKYGSDEERMQVVHAVDHFIGQKVLASALRKMAATSGSSEAKRELERALTWSLVPEPFIDLSDVDEVSRARLADFPDGASVLRSSFELINTCSIFGGYKSGDLIQFAAAPGIGKTTAMINEGASFLDQGFRVCHVFLGDMSNFDAWTRYVAGWTETPTDELAGATPAEVQQLYADNPWIQERLSRLRVKAFPAEQYDVFELIARVDALRSKFPFDALIVDYDGNIKTEGENLYKEGGTTYGSLRGYAERRRNTVLVGCQTKNNFWKLEVVPMEASAESSRKQHAIDGQYLIGVNPKCPRIGTGNLAKFRRGQCRKMSRLRFDYQYARIVEIRSDEYMEILENEKTADITSESLNFSDPKPTEAEALPPAQGETVN